MKSFGKTIIALVITGALSLTVKHYYEDSATKQVQTVKANQVANETYTRVMDDYVNMSVELDEALKRKREEFVHFSRRLAIINETKLSADVADTVMRLADKYDFYDETIVGMMRLESKYDIYATNYNTNGTVDKGLMQINSNTLPWLAKVIGKPDADPYNPHDSLEMGVWYINYLRNDKCDMNLTCAMSRYNGDSTGRYNAVVHTAIEDVSSRMGIDRARREK